MDAEIGDYLWVLRGAPREQAARVLPRLLSHLREDGVDDWRGVSPAHLHGFVRVLREQQTPPLRPRTVYSYTSTVRCFFGFLFARGRIILDPARELKIRTPRRLPRPVPSEAQVRRLVAGSFSGEAIGLRDRALIETLYGTGIRRGECVRLDLADADLRERRLFVRRGKGGKDRIVPLVGRAHAALDAYLSGAREHLARGRGEAALFLARTGERLGKHGVHGVIERASRAGGGAKLSPHLLRHACATHLLAGGADIRHVQVLLGHRSIETTALYTRIEASLLRRAIEEAHPLGAKRRTSPRVLLRRRTLRVAFGRSGGERLLRG